MSSSIADGDKEPFPAGGSCGTAVLSGDWAGVLERGSPPASATVSAPDAATLSADTDAWRTVPASGASETSAADGKTTASINTNAVANMDRKRFKPEVWVYYVQLTGKISKIVRDNMK